MGTFQRIFLIQRLTIVGLFASMYLSINLWTGSALFPVIKPLEFLPSLIPLAQQVLFGSVLVALFLVLVLPKVRLVTLIAVLLLVVLAFQNMHRWQPWYFQYFSILVMAIPAALYYKKYRSGDSILFGMQVCIALVYFYSGMFKVNPGFEEYIVVNTSNPITQYLWTYKHLVYKSALAIPWIEMGLAIALFVPKIRTWAVVGITLLHFLILYLIGPWGHNINSVVWPWNTLLIALVWVAFFKVKTFDHAYCLTKLNATTKVFLIVISIAPLLNWWDMYNLGLSYELYSGRRFVSHFKYPVKEVKHIPSCLQDHAIRYGDTIYVRTYDWANEQFNAPPNGDLKVLKATEEATRKLLGGKQQLKTPLNADYQ